MRTPSASLVAIALCCAMPACGVAKKKDGQATAAPAATPIVRSYRIASVAPVGLLAYWNIDEAGGSDVQDASGHLHTGVLTGAGTRTRGFSGGGMALAAQGGIKVEDASGLDLVGDATMSAWIRADDLSVDSYMRIFSRKELYTDAAGYELSYNPARGHLDLVGGGGTVLRAPIRLQTGWHHIAAVIRGGQARLVVDGVTRVNGAIGPIAAGDRPLWLGARNGDYPVFIGDLDEMRLYDRALGDAELEALAGVGSSNLVAHWTFDEGAGGLAADVSGYGHHGELQGATWTSGPRAGAIAFASEGTWVSVPASETSLAIAGQLSVAAWGRINDPSINAHMRIVSKKNAYTDADGYEFEVNPRLGLVTVSAGNGDYARAENVSLDAGWHHFACAVDGVSARIYVDGVDVTTDSRCAALKAGSSPLAIGRLAGAPYAFWDGALDDVRIYDRALSPVQVAALVQSGRASDRLGPFAWARQLYNPVLPQPRSMARDGHLETGVLASGGLEQGEIDLGQWMGDNQAGGRSFSGNLLIGDPGANFFFSLRSWDLSLGKEAPLGTWSYTTHSSQDAHLRIGWLAGRLEAVHGANLALGAPLPVDAIVLELPFRLVPGSPPSPGWQTGDYGGNPARLGVWQVPAHTSLGDAQKNPANLLSTAAALSALSPRPSAWYKLQVQSGGAWQVLVDNEADGLYESTVSSSQSGNQAASLPGLGESGGVVVTLSAQGGAKSGQVALSQVRLGFLSSLSLPPVISRR